MSDETSARLGLPYLAAGQMQKHVTLNEALTRLDTLVTPTVVSRTVAVQPGSPPDGAMYILPPGATGSAWAAAAAGDLLRTEAGGWTVETAPVGALVSVIDEGQVVVREAAGWTPLGARLHEVQGLDRLGLNTTADAGNPFAARLDKALWTARDPAEGGGDLRFTLNKAGPGAVLSLLMQSAWGGRAEFGLVGSDDFSLKVSDDGSTWSEVFTVDGGTGRASFAAGAAQVETQTFTADGTYTPPAWAQLVHVTCGGGGGGGGSGAAGPAGTSRFGGGGGGGGGRADGQWPRAALAGTLAITVGAGGAGGAGVSGTLTGNPGGAGQPTRVQSGGVAILTAGGGSGGGGGSTTAGAAGVGGLGSVRGNAGGAASITANADAGDQITRGDAAGGGGGGGGFNASGTARAGGSGGAGHAVGEAAARGFGGSGGGPGAPGQAGAVPADGAIAPAGGGGGGGGGSATAAGGAGGAGAGGGGGGGGGAGLGTAASGGGGSGAAGFVRITAVG